MASQVDIFNRALSRLGSRRVSAVDEDSTGAKACNAAWDLVRDEVLRAHPWNFSVARASIAADATGPEFEYDRSYTLPADCLRVLEVDTIYPWAVEGRKIVTDATAPLDVRYVSRVEDTEQYDSYFVSALAARLALEIAPEVISSSASQQENLLGVYQLALRQARATDGMESSPQEFEDDSWVTVR